MSNGAHDIKFALVVNLLGIGWVPKHIIIDLFEACETLKQTLTKTLQDLSKQYGLTKKSL